MEALLAGLEDSTLGNLMRDAGVWSYGLVNLAHILGVATLFGSVLTLDLRLLGVWRRVPLQQIEVPTLPLAIAGFCLAGPSGLAMLSTNATEYAGNPFLVMKFGALAVALLNVAIAARLPAWRQRHAGHPQQRRTLGLIGAISLGSWLAVVAAGRMIGYW